MPGRACRTVVTPGAAAAHEEERLKSLRWLIEAVNTTAALAVMAGPAAGPGAGAHAARAVR
ncbi:hypothetical protein NCCP1664_19840 [Zafaria cholistanensis]|uniref:Uncharacterized protein n=1 Tax=Zafaria cholistanensis TaxID=1682741 RepID=A0A5A7NUI3_9MICC|nr:hypothetical protein NCCP1664_19840 [Zafaria cholistanensis]